MAGQEKQKKAYIKHTHSKNGWANMQVGKLDGGKKNDEEKEDEENGTSSCKKGERNLGNHAAGEGEGISSIWTVKRLSSACFLLHQSFPVSSSSSCAVHSGWHVQCSARRAPLGRWWRRD